jgi:hypothetical protein
MKALAGEIHLITKNGKKIKLLSYQEIAPTKKPTLEDLFIGQFDHFGFSNEEKKVLSLNHRRAIFHYAENYNQDFEKKLDRLIKVINAQKDKSMVIEATDWGANLVYAALFSGKVDPKKNFHLNFTDSPLALIPNDYYKCLKPKNLSLHLSISPTSWMNEVRSMATPATHQLIRKLRVA